jgi:hypothetical protein
MNKLHLTLLLLALAPSALAATPAPFPPRTTTSAEQTGVTLTVYNSNLGLVKDRRELTLPPGRGELRFMDVASQIVPESVQITPLSGSESLRVLEQNYEYDLMSPQKLLDKYVGKEVKLYEKNPYSEREELTSATLVANNGTPIYRIGSDITFNHPGRVTLPGVPQDLIAKPTLVWLLDNDRSAPQAIEASYLTSGITWRADYVLTLNSSDDRGALNGWVTIDNRSGATYRDASLKLVAGEVNRVREEPMFREKAMRPLAVAAAPQFREQELFEYHLYSLERPTTVKENQTKQVSLLSAPSFPVRKEFLFRGNSAYFYAPQGDMEGKQKVSVFVELRNTKADGLGMPLPKGTVRVYKGDGDGALQFIGEDSIDHTPRDEKLRIRLGEAFDLVGSRKQTDWKKIATDSYEAAFEIVLRNHKKEDVTVRVVEPVPGDWKMLSSSHDYRKGDAFTAEFLVPVKKDGEARLTYRVRMRY